VIVLDGRVLFEKQRFWKKKLALDLLAKLGSGAVNGCEEVFHSELLEIDGRPGVRQYNSRYCYLLLEVLFQEAEQLFFEIWVREFQAEAVTNILEHE